MLRNLSRKPRVSIVMGSESDWSTMQLAAEFLKTAKVPFEASVMSAHRTPLEMMEYARALRSRGVQVVIAGAGGAAHLPGMVAAITDIPVIGVPIATTQLNGVDSLYSIVQMPRGVPVATVAINNSVNAAILAVQILASGGKAGDESLVSFVRKHKASIARAAKHSRLRFSK